MTMIIPILLTVLLALDGNNHVKSSTNTNSKISINVKKADHHHHQQQQNYYEPHMRDKVASSIAKGERRARERQAGRRELCDKCYRPPVQCVCSSLPPQKIQTSTHILVLQHPAEFRRKTFSTVPLLSLVLENVQIQVGRCFEPEQVESIQEALARGQKPLVLFPGSDAISLDKGPTSLLDQPAGMGQQNSNSATNKTTHTNTTMGNLIILFDGTWTQARRMARNSPRLLDSCQQVQFTATDSVSLYDSIREEPEPHCRSTLEACAQALTLLEPDSITAATATRHLHESLKSLVKVQLRHTSGQEKSVQRDPRFVSRAEARIKRKHRRLEVERQVFGGAKKEMVSDDDNKLERLPSSIIDLENGVTLHSLSLSDATFLDMNWEKRSKKSLGMIHQQMQNEPDYCLGISCVDDTKDEDDDTTPASKLCASILRYRNGALGMLFVACHARRRGFGSALLQEATRMLEERGEECVAFIVDGNTASEGLFEKQGWVRADPNCNKRGTGKRRAPRKWVKPSTPLEENDD